MIKKDSPLIKIILIILSVTLLLGILELGARFHCYIYTGSFRMGFKWRYNYEPFILTGTNKLIHKNFPLKGENYRIVILGGSTAQWVPDEIWLREFQKVSKRKIEVINLANAGHLINQERITLLLYGIRLEPDLLITLDGKNDIVDASKTMKPGIPYSNGYIHFGVDHPILNAFFGIFRNSQAAISLMKLKERKSEKEAQNNEELKDQLLKHYIEAIKSISIISKGLDIPYIIVQQPWLFLKKRQSDREQKLFHISYKFREQYIKSMFLAMDENLSKIKFLGKTYYINGNKSFDSTQDTCFKDEVHLTPNGNEILVNYIVDSAIKKGLKLD